jgi:hypothetical protein
MHPSLIAALVEDRRRSRPCGAVPQHPYGLCRKCHARMEWRRRNAQPARYTARRRRGRQARECARILALATSMFRASGRGADI